MIQVSRLTRRGRAGAPGPGRPAQAVRPSVEPAPFDTLGLSEIDAERLLVFAAELFREDMVGEADARRLAFDTTDENNILAVGARAAAERVRRETA